MRVLMDYRSALRTRSGAGEYVHQLAAAFVALFPPGGPGAKLDLTLFSSSWKDRLQVAPELDGVRTIDRRIPVSLLNLMWHRLGWPPVEALVRDAFDVTHSGHPLLLPSRAAAQVITIHDLNFLTHPERTRAEVRRDYPALARTHARRANAVLVPSHFTASEVERRLGVLPERIAVCPPGAPDWTPRTSAPTEGYVLFLGTLEPRKNLGTLLDAYARLLAKSLDGGPQVPELVLAGRATLDAGPWLDRIDRAPLATHVRHVGYVAPASRRGLYEGARLLVVPSFDEGFGIPALEAMTAGVPVVAANRGALPEVLGDAGLLTDVEDAASLAAAMERMIADTRFAAACVAKGVHRARHFSWRETAQRVFAVYRQAIEHRARPTR